jgi:hypothetical protein
MKVAFRPPRAGNQGEGKSGRSSSAVRRMRAIGWTMLALVAAGILLGLTKTWGIRLDFANF